MVKRKFKIAQSVLKKFLFNIGRQLIRCQGTQKLKDALIKREIAMNLNLKLCASLEYNGASKQILGEEEEGKGNEKVKVSLDFGGGQLYNIIVLLIQKVFFNGNKFLSVLKKFLFNIGRQLIRCQGTQKLKDVLIKHHFRLALMDAILYVKANPKI